MRHFRPFVSPIMLSQLLRPFSSAYRRSWCLAFACIRNLQQCASFFVYYTHCHRLILRYASNWWGSEMAASCYGRIGSTERVIGCSHIWDAHSHQWFHFFVSIHFTAWGKQSYMIHTPRDVREFMLSRFFTSTVHSLFEKRAKIVMNMKHFNNYAIFFPFPFPSFSLVFCPATICHHYSFQK